MSEPIEPDQIRVGDTVQRIETTDPMIVVSASPLAFGVRMQDDEVRFAISRTTNGTSWVLVSRPAPKPKVGQHWLSPGNVEWVFVERQNGSRFIGVKYDVWVDADVAPDGWTLKS